MTLPAPNLLSVAALGNGQVEFAWEPYTLPDGFYGSWGSVQGFDDKGIHVIGAFLYPDQLASGSAIVSCSEKHGIVHCSVYAAAHTTPTQYPTDPNDQLMFAQSNIVDVTFGHQHK